MTSTEIIILNYEEVRRRSIKLWSGIPEEFYNWQPDPNAMTMIEMVRHVLEGEHAYHEIIEHRGSISTDYKSPWENRPYTTIADEITFAQPYRQRYLEMVRSFSKQDLSQIEIVRAASGQRRKLGDYLLRVAYHESVHAGNIISYLRILDVDRPKIWD
ncbi:MAG: DinB family protein [Mucilaginibacter sp.]|nr:DinB family protein [Mucilaginibacter sp.]